MYEQEQNSKKKIQAEKDVMIRDLNEKVQEYEEETMTL
jgi:hypothetical protein